jgi:hypothetical protein
LMVSVTSAGVSGFCLVTASRALPSEIASTRELSDFLSGLDVPLNDFLDLNTSLILPTGDGERLEEASGGKRPVLDRLCRDDSEPTDSERWEGKVEALEAKSASESAWVECSGKCTACTMGEEVVREPICDECADTGCGRGADLMVRSGHDCETT